jgi:valyl-tRNA synthetase
MADTAVAVHPNDKRYTDLVGKQVWRPLAREKLPLSRTRRLIPNLGPAF